MCSVHINVDKSALSYIRCGNKSDCIKMWSRKCNKNVHSIIAAIGITKPTPHPWSVWSPSYDDLIHNRRQVHSRKGALLKEVFNCMLSEHCNAK